MTVAGRSAPIRGTQSMVGYMSWVFRRPLLTAIEVGWRWAIGIPLLLVCWKQWQAIVAAHPLEDSGLNSIDTQNPWLAVVQLANVWSYYLPHVLAVLRWLVPLGGLAWIVISGCGRSLLLKRMKPELPFRPVGTIVLQAANLALAGGVFLALVPVDAMGREHPHRRDWRARPCGLRDLGNRSYTCFLHCICAGELGAFDCSAALSA